MLVVTTMTFLFELALRMAAHTDRDSRADLHAISSAQSPIFQHLALVACVNSSKQESGRGAGVPSRNKP